MWQYTKIINELRGRDYRHADVKLTSVADYAAGMLVTFTVSHENGVPEQRVAYFYYISIETDNDTLVKKWDYIAK